MGSEGYAGWQDFFSTIIDLLVFEDHYGHIVNYADFRR